MIKRNDYFFGAAAFALPLLLLIGRSLVAGDSRLLEPTTVFLNWLYMASPQLVALIVAIIYAPSRQNFLVPALIGSGLLLITFQAWIWFFVTPRESGIAWLLYIPLWIVLLLAIAITVIWLKK